MFFGFKHFFIDHLNKSASLKDVKQKIVSGFSIYSRDLENCNSMKITKLIRRFRSFLLIKANTLNTK